jgi:hypothetical protein
MAARIINPTIKAFEGGVVLVDKLPTKNIKENIIYGVKTYVNDSDYIIKHWRRVNNKWVGFDHTGIIKPLTITRSGTYDVASEPEIEFVGDIEAGARYTYRKELSKKALKTLHAYANADGLLHKFTVVDDVYNESLDVVTKIVKVGNEYLLIVNQYEDIMTGSGEYWGYYYATSGLSYNSQYYPAGWSMLNRSTDGYAESLNDVVNLAIILRVPEDAENVFGSEDMWKVYSEELLARRLDLNNAYWMKGITEATGTINGVEFIGFDFNATPEVLYNAPILTINPEALAGDELSLIEAFIIEDIYALELSAGGMFIPVESEDGCLAVLGTDLTYVRSLDGLEVTGDIEVNKWYVPADMAGNSGINAMSAFGFYDYLPALELKKVDGYNPITVKVDKRKPEQTKTLTLTYNSNYTVTSDNGKALTELVVDTSSINEAKSEQTRTYYIYDNKTTTEIVPNANRTYSKVTINTNVSFPLQTVTATENGEITASSNYYAMGQVNVNVAPPLQKKIVYENGTVTADEGYYGISEVEVRQRPRKLLMPLIDGSGEGELVIPDTLTDIPAYAFYGQGYSTVVLPSALESIGESAFAECASLTDVYYNGTSAEWAEKGFAENFSESVTVHCSDDI